MGQIEELVEVDPTSKVLVQYFPTFFHQVDTFWKLVWLPFTRLESMDETLRSREQIMQLLRHNLHQAQDHMKEYVDLIWQERNSIEGDWVYLRLQPYWVLSTNHCRNLKLALEYYGHFRLSTA